MRVNVRNDKNQLIGFCDEHDGITNAIHLRKGYSGRYVKASDITYDKNGKVFCHGDGSSCLIRFADKGYL